MLRVKTETTPVRPLDTVKITGATEGTISVRDGQGREYARLAARRGGVPLRVGGALGSHVVFH
ncbi:MAG: hypothetical protein GF331_26370, partial [Chitinivibrionales bacterium]|nr:hypothetical protein [Chitinivibrionales bacterium]